MGLTIKGRIICALALVVVLTIIIVAATVIAKHMTNEIDTQCPECQCEVISYKETETGIEYYCRDCENRWSE